jgi:glycosyltransferase involved in cell wall biosynthesis
VVIVLNRRQKAVAHRYFGVDLSRCCIVNNIVPDSFLNNGRTSPDKRRVLCVGNLCRRKNQLQLIKALAGTEWNLRLVGRVLEGEEAYGAQIREAARAAGNVTIVGEVARNGQELMREYSEAGVFALLSQSEHQPISVLEALASGLPCVIADKPWSRQDAFDSCWQVPAASPAEIRRTVALAQRQAVNTVGRDWVAFNCRVPAVLAALERAYLQCR